MGTLPGRRRGSEKYRLVDEINRAGSMLDNVMYFNLRLDRAMFEPDLLEELCAESSSSVHVDQDGVLLRSLIVQLKIIPLPVYLRDAAERNARGHRQAGRCIRNNAATNIFNRDLDSRNYGVGRYGSVLVRLRRGGEADHVKMYESRPRAGKRSRSGLVLRGRCRVLPEELQHGMQLMNRSARKCFREENLDLLSVEYWEEIQQKLLRGEIPELQMFPESCKLDAAPAADDGGTLR